MGNRSKSLLKKGQSLGERAILEGEPAAESCTAGSPVLALIVNRSARNNSDYSSKRISHWIVEHRNFLVSILVTSDLSLTIVKATVSIFHQRQ